MSPLLSYFMEELTPQLFYQNYLPISASFVVKRILWYALRNIPSYWNFISTRPRSAWEKSKFESVFLLESSFTLLIFLSIRKSELRENVHFLTLTIFHCNRRRKYKLHSLLIASRLSTSVQLSISGLLIVMGKWIRNAILAQWNMIGHQLFASELIGNLFYLHAVIFEIPK